MTDTIAAAFPDATTIQTTSPIGADAGDEIHVTVDGHDVFAPTDAELVSADVRGED